MHRLALALGKSLSEVRAYPVDDLVAWQAYFRFQHKLADQAKARR